MIWRAFWDHKAEAETEFEATGRGRMDLCGFLHTIGEISRNLQFKPDDIVLDIGCGSGIVALALAPWVSTVKGMDLSPRMVERARANSAGVGNVSYTVGDIRFMDSLEERFDKILAYSVLQYLDGLDDLRAVFQGLVSALKPGGMALFAANPDPDRREVYREKVLSLDLEEEEKERVLKISDQALWLAPDQMVELGAEYGLTCEPRPISQRIWQHFYMFDLVVFHGR